MENPCYYDGTKLLSLKDINGETPEIYICTTNRTGGKTTYFGRLCVNKFLQKGEQFCLLYRYNYELTNVAEKFFNDIGSLFFPKYVMRTNNVAKGKIQELRLCDRFNDEDLGQLCGYAVALNDADILKRYSHLFANIQRILFDEFQSDTNKYCDNEVEKLLSIHTSFARGQGKQVRYLPVYMIGNPVTLLNPYYTELGISDRLKSDTKFLRGEGFVMEQGFVESAANAQKESGFNRAFAKNRYIGFAAQGVYLNDSTAFIEKPVGLSRYICTIRYNGKDYGVREYQEQGFIYCDDKADLSFGIKLSATTADHKPNYVMAKANLKFLTIMRYFFNKGCFRFKNLACKEVIMKTLSY